MILNLLRILAAKLRNSALPLTMLVYVTGVAIRAHMTFNVRGPDKSVWSDMEMYVKLSQVLQHTSVFDLGPLHVTHPVGYPLLLAWFTTPPNDLFGPTVFQFVASCLLPLAAGLLGASTFGRTTSLFCIAVTSLYFPYIDLGTYFLSEVPFTLVMALGFAALFAAVTATNRVRLVLLSIASGIALSIALTLKALAIPATVFFFLAYGLGVAVQRTKKGRKQRFQACAIAATCVLLGLLPLASTQAAICTKANQGHFCVSGSKSGADFLLGHYGRVRTVAWMNGGHHIEFGSPAAVLRHHTGRAEFPFAIYDGPANYRAAFGWVLAHPGQSLTLSLNHVYDAFFGVAAWPSWPQGTWAWADLSQLFFVLFLLFPAALSLRQRWSQGIRELLCSRAFLAFSPVLGLIAALLLATGEVRYRLPFDIFFIAIVGAHVLGRRQEDDPKLAEW